MRTLALLIAGGMLAACEGAYRDTARQFPADSELAPGALGGRTLVLTGQDYRGAEPISNVSVGLADSHVQLRPAFPVSLGYPAADIPLDAISGCRTTCFNPERRYADLLLGEPGIEISISQARELIELCWENDLPMISRAEKHEWMYSGAELPDREGYIRIDREEYERRARRGCEGY